MCLALTSAALPPCSPPTLVAGGHLHQYTRFPSLMNKGTQVTIDTDCLSADNGTYTNCKCEFSACAPPKPEIVLV